MRELSHKHSAEIRNYIKREIKLLNKPQSIYSDIKKLAAMPEIPNNKFKAIVFMQIEIHKHKTQIEEWDIKFKKCFL